MTARRDSIFEGRRVEATTGDVDSNGDVVDLLTALRRRLRYWIVLGWVGLPLAVVGFGVARPSMPVVDPCQWTHCTIVVASNCIGTVVTESRCPA